MNKKEIKNSKEIGVDIDSIKTGLDDIVKTGELPEGTILRFFRYESEQFFVVFQSKDDSFMACELIDESNSTISLSSEGPFETKNKVISNGEFWVDYEVKEEDFIKDTPFNFEDVMVDMINIMKSTLGIDLTSLKPENLDEGDSNDS